MCLSVWTFKVLSSSGRSGCVTPLYFCNRPIGTSPTLVLVEVSQLRDQVVSDALSLGFRRKRRNVGQLVARRTAWKVGFNEGGMVGAPGPAKI